MERVTNYIQIQSTPKLKMSPDGDFFKVWVSFLQPVHYLTKKEMDVLATCLKERHIISKNISDSDMVDSILLSGAMRKKICEQCGIKPNHLKVIFSKFRKNGIIRDNGFFLPLIPTIDKDGARLMINFSFKNEQPLIKLGPQANSKKP